MRLVLLLATGALALLSNERARSQAVLATYEFQNTYAADQAGKPALNPYAPGTGTLSFVTDTVNVGSQSLTRTVLSRGGSLLASPANQAGIELNTSGLLTSQSVYSAEEIFSLNLRSSYQRLLNTNDNSDNGLYVLTDNVVIYNAANISGTHTFTYGASTYHDLILTYDGTTAKEYLDGALDISVANPAMANPNNFMRFFLDNSGSSSNNDYGPGQVALIRLYDGVLSAGQVATIAAAPFAVPEPDTFLMTAAAGVASVFKLRRRKAV
jgi:hypothetical protein